MTQMHPLAERYKDSKYPGLLANPRRISRGFDRGDDRFRYRILAGGRLVGEASFHLAHGPAVSRDQALPAIGSLVCPLVLSLPDRPLELSVYDDSGDFIAKSRLLRVRRGSSEYTIWDWKLRSEHEVIG